MCHVKDRIKELIHIERETLKIVLNCYETALAVKQNRKNTDKIENKIQRHVRSDRVIFAGARKGYALSASKESGFHFH